MSNRADRRRMMREETKRNKALIASYTKQEAMARLVQQGISPDDLKREYDRGWHDAFVAAGVPIVKACYAGICIALHERFGFGSKRLYETLQIVDEKIMFALNDQELVDEVLEKTGLQINFLEPFDRIESTK